MELKNSVIPLNRKNRMILNLNHIYAVMRNGRNIIFFQNQFTWKIIFNESIKTVNNTIFNFQLFSILQI